MSAASDPVPRKKSPKEARASSGRHTLFLPIFILLLGLGALEVYQVMSMEDQLDDMTQAVDKMDSKVKIADYERTKFFKMASEVLRLAPTDANANKVAVFFKLRDLQVAQPELMNMDNASDIAATTNVAPSDETSPTNAAPVSPSPSTNAAPARAASPSAP